MAYDWHMIRLDLHEDPAVLSIAGQLSQNELTVVGQLHKLWSWANRHTTDGCARGVTAEWIDRYVGADGFAAALAQEGWLELADDCVIFPNFDRWMSDSAKKRGQAAKRKAGQRSQESGTGVPSNVGQNVDKSGTKRGQAKDKNGTVKKRREKKKQEPPIVPLGVEFPEGMKTPEIEKALIDWCTHRKGLGKKKTLKADQVSRLLRRPIWRGKPDLFCQAVDYSLSQGYEGLFPPDGASGGGSVEGTRQEDFNFEGLD